SAGSSGYTPCSIGGIIGPVAGIIGSIQALEAIKYLTGAGELLTNRLLIIDGETLRFTQFQILHGQWNAATIWSAVADGLSDHVAVITPSGETM
ncbi:MAG: hypothetical protein K2F75_04890, partial [Paramuribaculum sp.]|nr:hypothetical protein [Paramuribaculum sp.]